MKTPHSFRQNRFFTAVRFTTAVTLVFAAAAMAFVATKPPGPTLASSQDRLRAINKFRTDRDELAGNRRALPGDQEGGPLLAAHEDYAHRAYPAKDVPMTATLNAIAGFRHVRAMSMGRPSVGAWQMIGPSKSNFPDILTFSGAQYFTSGRVTALAIDPRQVAASGAPTTRCLAMGRVGRFCPATSVRTRLERSPMMLRITLSMLERASRMPPAIQKPALGSTNRPMAETRGRT